MYCGAKRNNRVRDEDSFQLRSRSKFAFVHHASYASFFLLDVSQNRYNVKIICISGFGTNGDSL